MSQGDPVSLVKDHGSGHAQEVYNRTKKEAHTIQADHCSTVSAGDGKVIELVCPGDNWHIRITEIHAVYTGQGEGCLSIQDGTVSYQIWVTSQLARLRFDTTRWTAGKNITVAMAAGGAQGYLNILGVFAERISDTGPVV